MTIFGLNIPLWVILTVAFAVMYVVFAILDKRRIKKQKAKREAAGLKNNADNT